MRKIVVFLLGFFVLVTAAQAEEGEKVSSSYLEIKPSIITNYGGIGKLRYFRSDISLRVVTANVERVEWHIPYIRSELVSLFSQQNEEALTTREGKEGLRQQALIAVQKVLEEEEGDPLVKDLLFTNFVIQK
ncbi:MAG: flagellar basal body-associated protein FliL [Pseudomonadales bacterium]|nr:flagellar basal body-associated protein FliL [Pseudomonadales bacterium]